MATGTDEVIANVDELGGASYFGRMGAWGTGSFENDHALDWVGDLLEGDVAIVRSALGSVANAPDGEFLDADDCCEALVAAELVAAACGKGDDRLAHGALDWIAAHRSELGEADRGVAARAVGRVVAGSELQELWDEGGPDEEWHASVSELLRRLSA